MNDSATLYRQSTAFGASPVGQVVALYDAILRDLHKANLAMAAGRVEDRVAAVNHSLTVIGELQGVLDFEKGGEPARNLENFYIVARNLIAQASMESSREKLQEAVSMFTRLRTAWSEIERNLDRTESTKSYRIASGNMQADTLSAEPPAEKDKPGGSGGWQA